MDRPQHTGILGAGAWGTALAVHMASIGSRVTLWARRPEQAERINAERENHAHLPGCPLPPAITATADLADLADADPLFLVTPAQHLREVLGRFAPHYRAGTPLLLCSKGIETSTGALLERVIQESLGQAPLAILSGPTFAAEVAAGKPAAVTLACADEALGEKLTEAIGSKYFRPYFSTDVCGVEVAGAVKNVIAIASGFVHGAGFGDNARAAILTRGLAEMARLGAALGAQPQTFMGLSGMGDLLLTATSTQSRNYSFGEALGRGVSAADIGGSGGSVIEGVHTADALLGLSRQLGVDMPIASAVQAVLHGQASVDEVVDRHLSRPFRPETE